MSAFTDITKSLKDSSNRLKQLSTNLKAKYKVQADRINECSELYKSARTMVSAIASDAAGGLNADSLSKLIVGFDGNWDKTAKSFDALFNSNKSAGHTNMLESFARGNFGNTVFDAGSFLKNRSSDYLGLYSSSKNLVESLINDWHAGTSLASTTKLVTDFDNNWDKWAKAVNDVFGNASAANQANVLETFAKAQFGNSVFNAGSVIKNETPNILNAIGTFKDGINAFGGSYRDPIEAAQRIKTGVDNIVIATEKMANSLNNVVKLLQGKGNPNGAPGFKGLEALGKLHETKIGKAVNTTLRVGAGAAAVVGDAGALGQALKSKDPKKIYVAGKQMYDDVRKLTKDNIKNRVGTPASSISSRGGKSANSQKSSPSQTDKPQSSDDDSSSGGIDDSYVCSGATMKCSFGTSSAKLTVYPDRTVYLTGQPMANITDHISLYNIAAFGRCKTTSFPSTGAATAANHGHLTPMPCVPGTQTNWINGKDDVLVKGDDALLKSSYCKCCWGGIITITNDGQK